MNILYGLVSNNEENISQIFPILKSSLSGFKHNQSDNHISSYSHIGSQTFNTNPAFKSERLIYSENEYQIISNARIDNLKELYKFLDLNENNPISNNELFLKLYLSLGDEFVTKLEGDWTLVIYNDLTKELFIARDAFGLSAIFYRKGRNYTAFSSVLKGLLEFDKENLHINEKHLAALMTVWDKRDDETAFENIHCIPPAHYLKIKDGQYKLNRYWEAEKTPKLILNTEREYVNRFNFQLVQAVKKRINNALKIGSQLSSGFDSSTITTVASEILKNKGKSLTAFTSIPKLNTSHFFDADTATDESYLTIPTAEFLGNVDLQLVKSESISLIKILKESIEIHHTPLHAAGNMYWIHDIFQKAQNLGIDTLLIGQYGNATISWTGYAENSNLKEIIKKGLRYPQNQKLTVKSYIIFTINKIKKSIGLDDSNTWDNYSFIQKSFAKKINLEKLMLSRGHDPLFRNEIPKSKKQINFINPEFNKIGQLWQDLSFKYGINVVDPSADKRLMEFCLSVPNDYFFRYNTPKWLLKTAMKGRLLDELINQQKKGRQSTDLAIRVLEEADEFKHLLDSFKKNQAIKNYLDLEKLENYLNLILLNHRDVDAYSNAVFLTRGISCALFIQKYK